MTVQLHRIHALLAFGRSRICWTPGLEGVGGLWYAGGSLEARIYVGLPDASSGSDGICTKCRISEAEVPTYRFWSGSDQRL